MLDLSLLNQSPFYELTALLLLASIVGFLSLQLRQPMIVSFILVGILAGPAAFGIVKSHDQIEVLAQLGIALLLFLVGLKLDLKLIRTMGWVALATGLGQVFFTSGIGYLIARGLGIDPLNSIYVAVALTFSSTIIIVKVLSDKREVDSLYGRIAIGFLIVQDLVVVLAMIVLSGLGIGDQENANYSMQDTFLRLFFYAMAGGVIFWLFTRYLSRPLLNRIARSPELLIIFSMALAATWAALGHYFGFSKEIGGLLAGISLASTPYRDAIAARMASLRDFLLLFFFIALGSQLNLQLLGEELPSAIVFSLFVLIGNPLIVLIIMGVMGYRKRTGFLAGLTVAQISEFSLIFMSMGYTLGHVEVNYLGLVTLVGLITITVSVYMITFSQYLYHWLEPVLSIFERRYPFKEQITPEDKSMSENYDMVLFGLGHYGKAIARKLLQKNIRLLAIDFNPDEVSQWQKMHNNAIYGDACDSDFIANLELAKVRWVICAIPRHPQGLMQADPALALIDSLKQHHYQGKIAVTSDHQEQIEPLKQKGAHKVFLPYYDAASQAVSFLCESNGKLPGSTHDA